MSETSVMNAMDDALPSIGYLNVHGICRRTYGKGTKAHLVFFKGTYDTPGMSHTGIYLGNGMMVSAGDPIKYANIHSSYWEKHLAGFGRLSK